MKLTCARCAGTGQKIVSAHYVVSCLVCGGKGYIWGAQSTRNCHQCQGAGKRNHFDLCLTCSGTGWARTFESKLSAAPDKVE